MDIRNPLEELIQRELAKLSDREAPASLVPRVLAQIHARQNKRWWQCPWTQWPVGLRLASMPLMLASMAAVVLAASVVWRLVVVGEVLDSVADQMGVLSPVWDVLNALGNAMLMLARAVGQEWVLLALFIPIAMYAACVGLGTLCYRVAFYKR